MRIAQPAFDVRGSLRSLAINPGLHVAFLLAAISLIYVPSLDAYFHGDDFIAIVDVAGKSRLTFLKDVATFQDNNYYWRPLGQAYYRFLYEIAGLNAFWFRLANLGVFLASLIVLYKLAIRLGLGRTGALVSVALVGFFANHVVAVAWITNGGRLLAALFFLLCLLSLHNAVVRRSLRFEVVGWLCFVAACLSDEVVIAMAPIPMLLSFLLPGKRQDLRFAAMRTFAYVAVVGVLLPPQFLFTIDDEWRLSRYHISTDMAQQAWALASQLVLPLTSADPMDVWFRDMPTIQWVAGGLAMLLGAAILLAGTKLMRLLVLWIAAALAPFTLWDFDVVSPRYTYLAAFPFALLMPLVCSTLLARVQRPVLRMAAYAPLAGALAAALVFGAVTTIERNEDFARTTRIYETAAVDLKEEFPDIPPGTRVVVYYGVWVRQDAWLEAMIRTLYQDTTLTAVNVAAQNVPGVAPQPGPQDLVLYYSKGQFSQQRPLAVR